MPDSAAERFHPLTAALYLTAVLLPTMLATHPLVPMLSLLGGLGLALTLGVRRLWWLLPAGGLAIIANALFNHAGQTVLLRLFGMPVTAQALAYGAVSATMLIAVLLWFCCLNRLLTTERLLCLTGRRLPSLSLLLVLTLRFVPQFTRQARLVWDAQRGLGATADNRRAKWQLGLQTLSGLIGWSFEHAVETADSMRARGQGLRPRSSFAARRLRSRDRLALVLMAVLAAVCGGGLISGAFSADYFPTLALPAISPLSTCTYLSWAALCGLPLIVQLRGAVWNRSLFKM